MVLASSGGGFETVASYVPASRMSFISAVSMVVASFALVRAVLAYVREGRDDDLATFEADRLEKLTLRLAGLAVLEHGDG